jgi:homoserine kinase
VSQDRGAGAPRVRVAVPATSANLGPGFDALAVAVDVHLAVQTVDRLDARVTIEGEGAGELANDDSNLVWRAFVAFCDHAGVATPDVSLHLTNRIPLERGMGSSAAAVVAGAALARAFTEASATDHALVALATELEGHPDNAAAAVHGGLVVCHDGVVRRLDPTEALRPVLCVPVARHSTAAARGLLPETVPLSDAAANGARAAAVLAGLSGGTAWDPTAMYDVLHEPARLAAMPDSGAVVTDLRARGIGACLSGAGPSVLAVVGSRDRAALDTIRAVMPGGWGLTPAGWDRAGAVTERTLPGRGAGAGSVPDVTVG